MKTSFSVLFCLLIFTSTTVYSQDKWRPISIHNRLLLNHLVLLGERRLQVMIACPAGATERVANDAKALDGVAKFTDDKIGYLRIDLPIERLVDLVNNPLIQGFQIVTLSRNAWYRDGRPRGSATPLRRSTFFPAVAANSSVSSGALPLLVAPVSRQPGYTADQDMNLDEWRRQHPTFDGRGVTIAMFEGAQVDLSMPFVGLAKKIDGKPVNKLVDILNAIDPDKQDDARVTLNIELDATHTWQKVQGKILILPRPGKFLLGFFPVNAGKNAVLNFAVLRSKESGEIWVDTDGDYDFTNEKTVPILAEKWDIRFLKVTYPGQADLSFVMTAEKDPKVLHIYLGRGAHQTHAMAVMVGDDDGLTRGVASGARVLLVRTETLGSEGAGPPEAYIEGCLMAAARPDVDMLDDSVGITFFPDTQNDFGGLIFRRLVEIYKKPFVHASGNFEGLLSSASALGEVWAMGGTISPATYAALYGGGELSETIIHPASSAGPGVDGALKPDFVTPMSRIAPTTCGSSAAKDLPRANPKYAMPPCYQISCCTSASAPYAAGLTALLISAAKQSHVDYSFYKLSQALSSSARFLPANQAYEQGNGLMNLEGAWSELQRTIVDPRIRITGKSNHPLMPYSRDYGGGAGIYETTGWKAGMVGERNLVLRREAGPAEPTEYRLSWTGNDGTFSARKSVVLPLNQNVTLPVKISAQTASFHSALLNIHDSATNTIVARSMATVIVPEQLQAPNYTAQFEGIVPLMRTARPVWNVPEHTAALSFELVVTKGVLGMRLVPSEGMAMGYYEARVPKPFKGWWVRPGTYRFVVTDPVPGAWQLEMLNETPWVAADNDFSTEEGQYKLTVHALGASIESQDGTFTIVNKGAELREPAIKASWAKQNSVEGEFNRSGFGNQFEINVPPDTASLIVDARMLAQGTPGIDLYLYDCTSGECFSENYALPSASQ
ncbi:MAG TPA: S8 family serine peptidase, partial [Pyrinomonadaceae bacterium]|nr:S8 family serine peptidase [Pyrinomonadaceae bacterium]